MNKTQPDDHMEIKDRVRAEDLLYAQQFSHEGEGKIKWMALGIAVVLHVIVFIVNFPEFKANIQEKKQDVIVVKRYVPPPPKIERKKIKKRELTRKVPIPDPTPEEPEPIREPEPEIEPEPLPPDVDFLIGVPEPPPPGGPLMPGVGGVTQPQLIAESKVEPNYPEIARVARREGKVILQAVIKKDGSVGDVSVLQCNAPGVGFENAAVEAVSNWKYRPAMQGDRAVDVFFTVVVEFNLS